MFHQLFEGLSLGIRIAALPPPKKMHDDLRDENAHTNGDGGLSASEEASNQGALKNNYLWLSPFSSSNRHHHRGSRSGWKSWKDIHWLKPTLSFLFAVTTPFGMTLGILAFGPGQRKDAGKFTLFLSCKGPTLDTY